MGELRHFDPSKEVTNLAEYRRKHARIKKVTPALPSPTTPKALEAPKTPLNSRQKTGFRSLLRHIIYSSDTEADKPAPPVELQATPPSLEETLEVYKVPDDLTDNYWPSDTFEPLRNETHGLPVPERAPIARGRYLSLVPPIEIIDK